jgi:quinoprotein glucose dehydrogenase
MKMPDRIEAQGGPITLVFSKGSGRAFFSERVTGNVWEIVGEEKYKLIRHLPIAPVTGHNETGVIGIALDPDFDENGYFYAYYTDGSDVDSDIVNKVVKFREKGEIKLLLDNIPAGRIHNGGIVAIGPDNKLYVGVGIGNDIKQKAQDVDYLGGKVLRINLDGSIPHDNPFPGSPVYSYGHRNMFGLAFHPKNGQLYICEEGPETDDEINIIKPGGNYGWPEAVGYSYGHKYVDPIHIWTPTITPTQSYFDGDSLYFGSYNEGTVHKLTLTPDGSKVKKDKIVYKGAPWGVIGVFKSPTGEHFVARSDVILKVKLKGE